MPNLPHWSPDLYLEDAPLHKSEELKNKVSKWKNLVRLKEQDYLNLELLKPKLKKFTEELFNLKSKNKFVAEFNKKSICYYLDLEFKVTRI